jgi:hypothetical protein
MNSLLAYIHLGGDRPRTLRRRGSFSPRLVPSKSSTTIDCFPEIPPTERPATAVYPTREILRCALPTNTYLSHPDFLKTEHEVGPKQIGMGRCGTIWELGDLVLKTAQPGKALALWRDCCNHKRVLEAFQQVHMDLRRNINVPSWESWVQPGRDVFWEDLRASFPEDFEPTYGLLTTRIQPLSAPVREALFDHFAPREMRNAKAKARFLETPANKDCLVRLYLGRRAQHFGSCFRLRNFDLMANEMEDLGLDTVEYARIMASALAILHWEAGLDADEVEFVLGRSPAISMAPTADELEVMGPESRASRENLRFDAACGHPGCGFSTLTAVYLFPTTTRASNSSRTPSFSTNPTIRARLRIGRRTRCCGESFEQPICGRVSVSIRWNCRLG